MKRFLAALALACALVIGISGRAPAVTTTLLANDSTLTWTVTGSIQGYPGYPSFVPFSCPAIKTTQNNTCFLGVGGLILTFTPADTTHFNMTVNATNLCGATSGTCTPVDSGTGATYAVATTATCGSGTTNTFLATQTARLTFPASCNCFGGLAPSITVSWNAVSSLCSG